MFAGNETDKELVVPKAAATDCTKCAEMAAIVRVKVAVPVPTALVALRATVEVPSVVGVPEIKPVPVFTDRPAGNPTAP